MLIVSRTTAAIALLTNAKDRESKTTVVVQDPGTYYVRHTPPPPPPAPKPTVEERINKLDNLAEEGYITPEEYKARKKEILDSI